MKKINEDKYEKSLTVHSSVIQMDNRLSKPAQDAWFELLNKCSHELSYKEEYSIEVRDLLDRLGHVHNNYEFVKS